MATGVTTTPVPLQLISRVQRGPLVTSYPLSSAEPAGTIIESVSKCFVPKVVFGKPTSRGEVDSSLP